MRIHELDITKLMVREVKKQETDTIFISYSYKVYFTHKLSLLNQFGTYLNYAAGYEAGKISQYKKNGNVYKHRNIDLNQGG